MAELTWQFSKLGQDCRRGYELAEYVHEKERSKFRIIVGDNQGEAKVGLSEFQRLVGVGNAAVVVTTRSPVGLAINPISHQKKIPIVGIVAHPSFTENPYSIRIFPSSAVEGDMLGKQIVLADRKRVAMLTLEDDYFLALTKKVVEQIGSERIAISEKILPTETDYRAVLLRIKSAKPDSVVLNVGPQQLPALLQSLRRLQITGKIFSNFTVSAPDVIAASGDAVKDVTFVQLDFDKPKFRQLVNERFATPESSPIGYSCFLGLSTVLQAISRSDSTPESVQNEMLKIGRVHILGETVTFVGREAQLSLVPRRIHQGKVSPLVSQ